ncbi:MAG: hypothetical protein INR71_11445, partial [Terriglobus roseus]|nr:hypothetical protein [Terriglobus roseus]
ARRPASAHWPAAGSKGRRLLEDELGIASLNKKLASGTDVGHVLSPRFMRRLYAVVLDQCPLLTYDDERKGWRVHWYRASDGAATACAAPGAASPGSGTASGLGRESAEAGPEVDLSLLFGPASSTKPSKTA